MKFSAIRSKIESEIYFGYLSEDSYMEDIFWVVIEELAAKYDLIGYGGTRVVFDTGDGNVIKIAYNDYGVQANGNEVNRPEDHWIPVAKCEFFEDSQGSGLCIIMEKVEVVTTFLLDKPYWVDYVDCQQVGYNSKGELVAYDL